MLMMSDKHIYSTRGERLGSFIAWAYDPSVVRQFEYLCVTMKRLNLIDDYQFVMCNHDEGVLHGVEII